MSWIHRAVGLVRPKKLQNELDDELQFHIDSRERQFLTQGMTPEQAAQIFSPFYTTKGSKGTGLGLAVVHGIVTRHSGEVQVKSRLGVGSRFTMRFPATIAVVTQASDTREHLRSLSAQGRLDTLKTLPQLANFITLSSLLYNPRTSEAKPDLVMREAAARMHADAVLIVATETQATDGKIIAPLTELSLGLFPNKRYELVSTALAALVDTRTGYVYGAIEESKGRTGFTMAWGAA